MREREDFNAYLSAVMVMKTEGYPKGIEGYLVPFATCHQPYKRD